MPLLTVPISRVSAALRSKLGYLILNVISLFSNTMLSRKCKSNIEIKILILMLMLAIINHNVP